MTKITQTITDNKTKVKQKVTSSDYRFGSGMNEPTRQVYFPETQIRIHLYFVLCFVQYKSRMQ